MLERRDQTDVVGHDALAIEAAGGVVCGSCAGRRGVLRAGLATAVGMLAWGCSGGREPDAATPPRVTQQRRPAGGTPVDPRPRVPSAEPSVRVLVGELEAASFQLHLAATGRWIRVRDAGDGAGTVLPSPIELSRDGDRWRLAGASGPVLRLPLGRLNFATVPGEAASLVASVASGGRQRERDQRFGGVLEVVPGSNGRQVDLVATLPMETYLPGVVAKELYGHWSPAAFRAQVIAARSFAVCEIAHWANRRHYDVCTGPDTQAWAGLVASGLPASAAAETRGLVLAWDDRVVPAYYSSCCGGLPAEASEAISSSPANAIPPLDGRSDGGRCCEWAATYRWERIVATPIFSAGLTNWGRQESTEAIASLDGIHRIEVSAMNRHGRPTRFRIEDRHGRAAELRSERARRAFAAATPASAGRFFSAAVEPKVEASRVHFEGRGFGHGVGLCQHGAEAMARSRSSDEAILRRYYPGATIVGGWT